MPPLSIYILPGRVDDPARGIQEAIEAERLGFDRIWLAERYDLKEAGAVLGATAAVTNRIGLATGLVIDACRTPLMTAAMGATLQALSDGRFTVLGTVLGGVFVVWVGLGLVLGGLSPLWVNTINGLVLVGAVSLSTAVRSRR